MIAGKGMKENGARPLTTTNIFSALESRRKKPIRKTPDEDKQDMAVSSLPPSGPVLPPEPVAQVSWTPRPVSVTSWADCCEDEEDEYFAMPSLPPLPPLDDDAAQDGADLQEAAAIEDSIEDLEISGDEASEEDNGMEKGNEENKEPLLHDSDVAGTCLNAHTLRREPDRQMSKKELKKKGLAELEATLAELGLNTVIDKDSQMSMKMEAAIDDGNMQLAKDLSRDVSKSFKRRKARKEKSFKDGRQGEPYHGVFEPSVDGEATAEFQDKTELLKKLSSPKKKKSKGGDSAARAVASEAAIRASKLAALRKKEKSQYNQQPR